VVSHPQTYYTYAFSITKLAETIASEQTPQDFTPDVKHCELTTHNVLAFLSESIAVEEIAEAFPDEFSLEQLRAIERSLKSRINSNKVG